MKPEYLKPNDPQFCLAHMIEEMGEAMAAAGKTLRWGPQSVNPELPEAERETNIDWLLREMDDVEAAFARFRSAIAGETNDGE
jgi:hypothetical protein